MQQRLAIEQGRLTVKDSPEACRLFSVLQILTAVFGAFAHGGNDVRLVGQELKYLFVIQFMLFCSKIVIMFLAHLYDVTWLTIVCRVRHRGLKCV